MAAPSNTLALVEITVLLLGLSGSLLMKINTKQPKPYMDEIFHIPQAQKYCNGNFKEWDPMITTLPGLYVVNVAVAVPISWFTGVAMSVACSTFWLRAINVMFTVGNLLLLCALVRVIHGDNKEYDPMRGLVTAATLCVFPVLYFFTFLYYTDVGSTFFVLLSVLLCLRHHHVKASLAGTVAVLFRQTNIIWVIYCGCMTLSHILMDIFPPKKKDITEETLQSPWYLWMLMKQLLNTAHKDKKTLIKLVLACVKTTWSYILVGLAFLAFIYINKGIVVGAKDHHQACFHGPQLLYFAIFAVGFSFIHHLSFSKLKRFVEFLLRRPVVWILFCLGAFVVIWKLTYEHQYLLADNRHYTFYVWQKVFRRYENAKYALIPVYMVATWCLCDAVKQKNILWKITYTICIALVLVPQMLLEFRYFIVPYLLLRLNMPLQSYFRLGVEIVFYIAINSVTLYLFMEKTFKWPQDNSLQRFMW